MEIERNEFGVTTYDSGSGTLELDWTDATEHMSDAQFRSALERFAAHSVSQQSPNVLIDVTRFAHRMSPEVGAWRDEHVIPRYNEAGVKKMAFLVPSAAPGTVKAGTHLSRKARRPSRPGTSARGRPCLTGLPQLSPAYNCARREMGAARRIRSAHSKLP